MSLSLSLLLLSLQCIVTAMPVWGSTCAARAHHTLLLGQAQPDLPDFYPSQNGPRREQTLWPQKLQKCPSFPQTQQNQDRCSPCNPILSLQYCCMMTNSKAAWIPPAIFSACESVCVMQAPHQASRDAQRSRTGLQAAPQSKLHPGPKNFQSRGRRRGRGGLDKETHRNIIIY